MNFENEIVDEAKGLERIYPKRDKSLLFFSIALFVSGFLWRELHWPFAGAMIIIGNGLLVSSFLGMTLINRFNFQSSGLLLFSISSFIGISFWFGNDGYPVLGGWIFLIGLIIEVHHFRKIKKEIRW